MADIIKSSIRDLQKRVISTWLLITLFSVGISYLWYLDYYTTVLWYKNSSPLKVDDLELFAVPMSITAGGSILWYIYLRNTKKYWYFAVLSLLLNMFDIYVDVKYRSQGFTEAIPESLLITVFIFFIFTDFILPITWGISIGMLPDVLVRIKMYVGIFSQLIEDNDGVKEKGYR